MFFFLGGGGKGGGGGVCVCVCVCLFLLFGRGRVYVFCCLGGGVFIVLLFGLGAFFFCLGKGRVHVFAVWAGGNVYFVAVGAGGGSSLTPVSSLRGPAAKKTKQQKTKTTLAHRLSIQRTYSEQGPQQTFMLAVCSHCLCNGEFAETLQRTSFLYSGL